MTRHHEKGQALDDASKSAARKRPKAGKKRRQHDGVGTVLVPVDFSHHSLAALLFAARLADGLATRLEVLHVVHDPAEMPGYYAKLVKKKRVGRVQDIAKEVFDDFMVNAIEDHPNLSALRDAGRSMVMGLPVTRILEVIDKTDPLMVIMGSQGRTGLEHLMLGSKAEHIVRLSPVPVTVVKSRRAG